MTLINILSPTTYPVELIFDQFLQIEPCCVAGTDPSYRQGSKKTRIYNINNVDLYQINFYLRERERERRNNFAESVQAQSDLDETLKQFFFLIHYVNI